MTTAQLLVLLLVIVVAVVLVWLLVRRSAARKDDARAEAAGLRAEAEGVASALAGQEAFAEQAEDRAQVARTEADRLAAEASGYRETVEVVREDHRSMLARADEIDPDVDASDPGEGERRPMTRAEARQMREEAERAAWAGSPAAPVPGAAGAAVMGRDTGGVVRGPAVAEPEEPLVETSEATQPQESVEEPAEPSTAEPVAEEVVVEEPGADESTPVDDPAQAPEGDEDSEERSARIAAATDYRDGDAAEGEPYVWGAATAGTEGDMDEPQAEETSPADENSVDESTHTAATEAQTPTGEWGGPHADDAPVAENAADTDGAEAADTDGAEAAGADGAEAADVDTDESPAGTEVEPEADADDPTPERDWAADEGELLAENSEKADELAAEREQMDRDAAAVGMEPVHPEVVEQAEHDEQDDADVQHTADEQDTAVEDGSPEAETAADEDADTEDESALDGGAAPVEQPVADGEDAAPLVDEPEEPEVSPQDGPQDEPADVADDGADDGAEPVADDAPDAAEEPAHSPRRISEFDEIRDGGYGMGSAAAIEDGAQPLDHPVQAYRDTMTYRVPGDPGYDEATADVWFYDQGAAERSGFRRSEG